MVSRDARSLRRESFLFHNFLLQTGGRCNSLLSVSVETRPTSYLARSPWVGGSSSHETFSAAVQCAYVPCGASMVVNGIRGRDDTGRGSNMWNGQANRSIDDTFYRRPAWKKCRAAFIAHRQSIDGGLCQRCQNAPGRIVHHRIHLTADTVDNPDVCYGFHNLEYVCLDCHNIEHGYVQPLPDGAIQYAFDADGNPVAVVT